MFKNTLAIPYKNELSTLKKTFFCFSTKPPALTANTLVQPGII